MCTKMPLAVDRALVEWRSACRAEETTSHDKDAVAFIESTGGSFGIDDCFYQAA